MMMLKIYVRRLTKNINQSNTIYKIEKKNFYLANSFFQSTIKLLIHGYYIAIEIITLLSIFMKDVFG